MTDEQVEAAIEKSSTSLKHGRKLHDDRAKVLHKIANSCVKERQIC
jgi:hypothetical protein